MTQKALGMIETYGMVAAVEAADVALKTAAVELINYEIVKSGRIMIAIYGEVAAVQASVAAGAAAASKINRVFNEHVIPRPLADPRLLVKHRDGDDTPEPDGNGGGRDSCDMSQEVKELEALSVPKLRDLARKTEGIAIKGRQISRANKKQLIEEILQAKKRK